MKELRLSMQKLHLVLLSDLGHNGNDFGAVWDDYAHVWQTLTYSHASAMSSPSAEVEDTSAFVWAEDAGCTYCDNNNRGERGYMDRHTFKFKRDFHSASHLATTSGRGIASATVTTTNHKPTTTFDDIPTHDARVLDTNLGNISRPQQDGRLQGRHLSLAHNDSPWCSSAFAPPNDNADCPRPMPQLR
jgi:hypothetical protein